MALYLNTDLDYFTFSEDRLEEAIEKFRAAVKDKNTTDATLEYLDDLDEDLDDNGLD